MCWPLQKLKRNAMHQVWALELICILLSGITWILSLNVYHTGELIESIELIRGGKINRSAILSRSTGKNALSHGGVVSALIITNYEQQIDMMTFSSQQRWKNWPRRWSYLTKNIGYGPAPLARKLEYSMY